MRADGAWHAVFLVGVSVAVFLAVDYFWLHTLRERARIVAAFSAAAAVIAAIVARSL